MINHLAIWRTIKRNSPSFTIPHRFNRILQVLFIFLTPSIILIIGGLILAEPAELPQSEPIIPEVTVSQTSTTNPDTTDQLDEKLGIESSEVGNNTQTPFKPVKAEPAIMLVHLDNDGAVASCAVLDEGDDTSYLPTEVSSYHPDPIYDPVGAELERIIASDTSAYIEPPIEPALLDETQFRAWQAELNRYTTDPLELLAQAESMKNFDPTHQNNLTGQPLSVENYQPANQAVNTVQYHYNGDGNLVGKTVDGVRTDFALDVAADLPEVIYTSEGNRYLHLPGMIMTENANGEVRYLLSDGLGSIRQVVDEAGQVVASYEYDPYGNPVQTSGGDPYGYTGEWWENDVGLLHLRARWYSPETGTFISKDPSELEQNPYQYAASNPINNIDPSGYVFVTFDDGPVNNDLEILDILRRNNAQATFFYHGKEVDLLLSCIKSCPQRALQKVIPPAR